jgi:hypothetical protein
MAAIIQINSGTPGVSNDNLTLGAVVTLTSVDTALHSYTWAIVSQPEGSNDNIVGSGQIVTFTPTKEGSYLVKLTVDFGYPSEDSQQLIAAVRELETGDRIPAIGETTENSANDGWANPVDAILRRVTRFTEAGVQPGVAAEALVVGDVVYASDVYTLAAGLPGERVVASWSKCHADVVAEVQGVFGVVAGSVNGGSIATDDIITVQTTGLYQGVPFASAPSIGDPVFISDTASLSLTQGAIKRQIGTVCAVGASTYDVMVGPAPAELATANLYAKTYWVSTAGSDVVGDGSINNPFATPQKAHDVALVDYPTDWVSVEIGPGSYVGGIAIEKWNIVFHGSGSRPETQATKLLGIVTVTPDGATQKFNDVIGLDRLYVEYSSVLGGAPALYVTGTGAFSLVVTDCYLTTSSASATATVLVEPSNAIRPRVVLNDCIVTVQTAGPDIVYLDQGDVRMSNVQLLFGSAVPSGSAGKGITVANDASLFADRLLLDMQTLGPAIEVTGGLAGTKLTLSNSAITLSNASCSHAISATNSSAGQLAVFAWNCVFGIGNAASKIINGTGSLGSNIAMVGQLSTLYGTVGGLGSTVTRLDMSPGVLAYTNASYPAPSGLTPPAGSAIIPIGQGAAGTPVQLKADNSSGATQSPGARLIAGSNTGAGSGGDARLLGGESSGYEPATVSAGGATSTVGGSVAITAGLGPVGGAVSITAGEGDTTVGGNVDITGGLSSGSSVGGNASLTGGGSSSAKGGSAYLSGGFGVYGGDATISGGQGSVGGIVSISGGLSNAGSGGDVTISGGDGTGSTGGNVSLDSGTGTVNGQVDVGLTHAQQVKIGRSGKDVSLYGRNVGVPTTYAPLAATTIPVNGPTIFLNPAANRDMTASPTLQTSGITAGTIVTLVNEDSTFYVDLTQDAGGTSYLKLATGNIFLFKYDTITLIFDGTYWVEVGRNVQPGKSYTPVAGTTIPVLCPVILLANAGAVDLGTAVATIQTVGINAGTRVTFVQKGTGTTTFRRGGSTLCRLTNASHAVAQYGTLELVYDGANWCEVALANNA